MLASADDHGSWRRILRRILGVLATSALLGAAVVIGLMISDAITGDDGASESPVAGTSTPRDAAPDGRPKLTRREAAARRAAVAVLQRHGFKPVSLRTWRPERRLRVLVGRPRRKGVPGRRAFFFAGRRYVGTDTAEDSGAIRVLPAGGDRRVTLRYRLYGPDDRPCCPTGETADVRYQWTGSDLRPLDSMPAGELRTVRR